ncbi:MAG: YbaB/EbfC family nucleoid-associated protein [Actinobacteria bacterium]|nr:YbaB/EbfC family nucleoid-associated protein [Actinomycetota bacterium]
MEPGGQLNMQQLLQAAAGLQNQLMSAQQELADAEIEGSAGGGLVTVTVNGQGELVDLTITPAAIEGGDPAETAQTIADLVLAAYRDACEEADNLQQETMAPLAAGLGAGGLPGVPDLSSITGLPGGPGAEGSADATGKQPPSAAGNDKPDRKS